MTYSEFLDFISNGCTLIFNTLIQVANNLMTNYFFITIFGLVIFMYLFDVVTDLIFNPSDNIKNNVDKWNNAKRNYLMNMDVKTNLMQTHPNDFHNLKYMNLVMSKDAQLDYLHAYEGYEYMIKSVNLRLGREVAIDSFSVNKDLEYLLKYNNYVMRNQVAENIKSGTNVLPSWFEQDIKKKKMSKKESKELDDLLTNF